MAKVKDLKQQKAEQKLRQQINKAASTYLCDQDEGDNYDAYLKLQEVADKGNGDDRAADHVTVWQPLENSVSVDEMIELINCGIESPELPEFVTKIDWTLLKGQKKALLEVIDFFGRVKFNAKTNENPRIIEGLEGILSLIDSLQDAAVDDFGLKENLVFDLHPEDDCEKDDDGNCIYCGHKCWDGEMCDEQQAGGFNN